MAKSGYSHILKTTGITGGVQVVKIITKIITAKFVAIFLGPSGTGIVGLYNSTLSTVQTLSGLGIPFSAVRNIALANGENDQIKIAKTIKAFRLWVWCTGLGGMLIVIVFSSYLSKWTFGSTDHAWAFVLLSVTVLFTSLSLGQIALLQGLRQIKTMAKANVLGAVLGMFLAVPIYWYWGAEGIVAAIILLSFATLWRSWVFARRIKITPVTLNKNEFLAEGKSLIGLGVVALVNGLGMVITGNIIRVFIQQKQGIAGVGIFQCSWGIGVLYMAMIFQAMSADYFPGLSASKDNYQQMKISINQQTVIALIIGLPVIIFLLLSGNTMIKLLYTSKFIPAFDILKWQITGDVFKLAVWPVGFIFPVLDKRRTFIFTEIFWNGAFLLLSYLLWPKFGLEGVGIAFLFSYILYFFLVKYLANKLGDFRWTKECIVLMLFSIISVFFFLYNSINFSFSTHLWYNVLCCLIFIFLYLIFINRFFGLKKIYIKILSKISKS